MGIARTFQIVQPFAGLSVAENIAVGAYLRHARRADAVSRAAAVARRVGLHAEIDRPAASLTVAGRKRLELARALATEPKILLLDEVLAGLNPSEIRDMVPVIRAIRDDGVTIFMIEHVMQAVMDLCETVHVLVAGPAHRGGRAGGGVRRSAGDRGLSRKRRGAALPAARRRRVLEVRDLRGGYGGAEVLRGVGVDGRSRRDRRHARLERRRQDNAQPRPLRALAAMLGRDPLRRQADRRRPEPRPSWQPG